MVSLVFWSTILDITFMNKWPDWYKSSPWCPALRTFSASYHAFKLFQVPTGQNGRNGHESNRVDMVDNIRFMFAVVTAGLHSIGCAIEYRGMQKMSRMKPDFEARFTDLSIQPFFNVVGIEAFFCIAGITTFLSAGHLFRANVSNQMNVSKTDDGKVTSESKVPNVTSFLQLILFRFLRLFPGIMTLVAIDISVWPLFASLTGGGGPMYTEITSHITNSCTNNWWKSALLVNNWTDVTSICLIHTWYLSAEFQLFLVGVFSLFLFRIKDGAGVIFSYTMILIGMFLPASKAYFDGHSPTILFADHDFEAMNTFTSVMYLPTTNHLSPYFIGILVAYYYKKGSFDMRVTIGKRIIGTIFFSFYTAIFYAPGYWNTYKNEVEPITAAIYVAFHRVLWTLGFLSSIMFMKDTNDMVFRRRNPNQNSPNSESSKTRIPTSESSNFQTPKNNNSENNNFENEKVTKSSESTNQFPTLVNDSNGYTLSREFVQMCTMIFITSSKLYFSLYLIHPLFIKYDWFSRRSMAEFTPFANVSMVP